MTRSRVVMFSETNSKFGAPILMRLLADTETEVRAVVTRHPGHLCDYYVGEPYGVDLAQIARDAGVKTLQPNDVNSPDIVSQLRDAEPDYFIVANYQQILRGELLSVPLVTTVNFHPSPLPRYAGLAPFYWMAENHEHAGGVSAVQMTDGLDDGPVVAQQLLSLRGEESAAQIRQSHFEASWRLFDLVLPTLHDRSYRTVPQDASRRTYYGKPPVSSPTDRHEKMRVS